VAHPLGCTERRSTNILGSGTLGAISALTFVLTAKTDPTMITTATAVRTISVARRRRSPESRHSAFAADASRNITPISGTYRWNESVCAVVNITGKSNRKNANNPNASAR
jgi:hypothetical protein